MVTGASVNLLSVAFYPGDLNGYIGNSKSKLLGVALTPVGSSYTLAINNSLAGSPAPANSDLNALHVFDNGSVMVAGENNFIGYFDGNATWINLTSYLKSLNGRKKDA